MHGWKWLNHWMLYLSHVRQLHLNEPRHLCSVLIPVNNDSRHVSLLMARDIIDPATATLKLCPI
jgi:hypothetical protein